MRGRSPQRKPSRCSRLWRIQAVCSVRPGPDLKATSPDLQMMEFNSRLVRHVVADNKNVTLIIQSSEILSSSERFSLPMTVSTAAWANTDVWMGLWWRCCFMIETTSSETQGSTFDVQAFFNCYLQLKTGFDDVTFQCKIIYQHEQRRSWVITVTLRQK